VIGAGQLATGIVEGLVEGRRGHPSGIVVANRTELAAHELAGRFPERLLGVGLEALADSMVGADLVISAVESDQPLITTAMLEGVGRAVLVIDLGMPRTVAHDDTAVEGVTLLDLAHLRDVVETALRERREELADAEVLVVEEVDRYLEDRRARGAAPVVTRLRARLEELRIDELERTSAELSVLSDDDRARIDRLTKSIVAKIAHEPTVALRESAGTDRGQRLADAVRALFDL
jgi:glutamyl-tRNA reductase